MLNAKKFLILPNIALKAGLKILPPVAAAPAAPAAPPPVAPEGGFLPVKNAPSLFI